MWVDPSILAPEVFKQQHPYLQHPLVHTRILWTLALCGNQYITARKVGGLIDSSTAKTKMCLRHLVAFGLVERRKSGKGIYVYRLKPEVLASLRRCPRCGSPARPIWRKHKKSRNGAEEWVCLRCRHTFKLKRGD